MTQTYQMGANSAQEGLPLSELSSSAQQVKDSRENQVPFWLRHKNMELSNAIASLLENADSDIGNYIRGIIQKIMQLSVNEKTMESPEFIRIVMDAIIINLNIPPSKEQKKQLEDDLKIIDSSTSYGCDIGKIKEMLGLVNTFSSTLVALKIHDKGDIAQKLYERFLFVKPPISSGDKSHKEAEKILEEMKGHENAFKMLKGKLSECIQKLKEISNNDDKKREILSHLQYRLNTYDIDKLSSDLEKSKKIVGLLDLNKFQKNTSVFFKRRPEELKNIDEAIKEILRLCPLKLDAITEKLPALRSALLDGHTVASGRRAILELIDNYNDLCDMFNQEGEKIRNLLSKDKIAGYINLKEFQKDTSVFFKRRPKELSDIDMAINKLLSKNFQFENDDAFDTALNNLHDKIMAGYKKYENTSGKQKEGISKLIDLLRKEIMV